MALVACEENIYNHYNLPQNSFKIKQPRQDGLLLQVHHTIQTKNRNKCLRFICAAFNDTNEQIAASDQSGNIFIIDLISLNYWMISSSGRISTIAYSTLKKNEVLVAKDSGVVEFVNTDTGVLCGELSGHNSRVNWISFAEHHLLCITGSKDEAFIWNLETKTQIQELTLRTNLEIKLVRFTPVHNDILICFEDDTIQIWRFGNWATAFQMPPDKWGNHQMKTMAFSRDGLTMVAGGDTSSLFVVALKDLTVKCTNCLPSHVTSIKQLEFLSQPYDGGENRFLMVLTNDFVIYIVCINSNAILQRINFPKICISRFIYSENGKYTLIIIDTGEMNIYLNDKLLSSFRKAIENLELYDRKGSSENSKSKYHENCSVPSDTKKQIKTKPKSVKADGSSYNYTLQLNNIKKQMDNVLNVKRLKPMLREFGEYPENYRSMIWKSILKLPNNHSAFQALVNKGIHVKTEFLDEEYPLQNKYLLSSLKRVISCLSHWSPLFSQVQYLPFLVFPFVKVFKNDPLAGFEAVVSVLVNWCQRWFEFFPFPPVNVLSMVENLLSEWDQELMSWFNEHQITAHIYAWSLLETVFSEGLTTKEWLKLFDHILCNEPSFMIFAVVSYNIACRTALLHLTEIDDFKFFYHNRATVDMKSLILKMYHMNTHTKDDNHPRKYLKPFKPLLQGEMYQVFNDYPRSFIDKQAEQINAMKQEELELISEQARLAEIRVQQEKEHENAMNRQMQSIQLRDLEAKYKEAVIEEETRLAEHRHKVMNMKKELRRREKTILDETRDEVLRKNVEKKKFELEDLLRDIDRKRVQQEMLMKDTEEELFDQCHDLIHQKKELLRQLEIANSNYKHQPEHKTLREQQKTLTDEIIKLREEASSAHNSKTKELAQQLAAAECLLQAAEVELAHEMAERQNALLTGEENIKIVELENETRSLEKEVANLLSRILEEKQQESKSKKKQVKDSLKDRQVLLKKQLEAVQTLNEDNNYSEEVTSSCVAYGDSRGESSSPSLSSAVLGTSVFKKSKYVQLKMPFSTTNDRICRSLDFYRQEQEAIRSSMNLREQLLRR